MPAYGIFEIDARPIYGQGGTVRLLGTIVDETAPNGATVRLLGTTPVPFSRFTVEVTRPDGSEVVVLTALSREEALDAFRHTFARKDVPDIFARVPDPEDETEDETPEDPRFIYDQNN